MSVRMYEFIEVTYDDSGMHQTKPVTVSENWMENYLSQRITRTRSILRSKFDGSVTLHRFFMIEALFTPTK